MKTPLQLTRLFAFCLTIAMMAMAVQGEENLNYVVSPLRTQLHRSRISRTASAFAIVNAIGLLEDDMVDLGKLPSDQFEADLKTLAAKDDSLLRILLQHCDGKRLTPDSVAQVKNQLVASAKANGFREVQFTEEWTSSSWEMGNGSLGTGLMDDPGEENLIKNNILIAAPLRTRISMLRVGTGDVLIELRQPFDALHQELSEDTKEAIRKVIESMDLESTGQIMFDVNSSKAGEPLVEKLFSNRRPPPIPKDASPAIQLALLQQANEVKLSPALELAQELGFDQIGYRHSPNGGAPEKLINAQAPDFELKDLDGNLVTLSKWRGDRPALISFWGVGCGPCRLEAPHLSRLHEKYGDKVAIIAVDAYDETAESVQTFVKKEMLKHPIVIGGGELARSTYHVAAYPTTFFVNRHGQVVRYMVGFEDGELLESDLVSFLAEQQP